MKLIGFSENFDRATHGVAPTNAARHGIAPTNAARHGVVPTLAARHGVVPTLAVRHGVALTNAATHGVVPTLASRHGVAPKIAVMHGVTPTVASRHGVSPTVAVMHGIGHMIAGKVMRGVIPALISLCFASSFLPASAAVDLNHTLFTADLKEYVDRDLVHYKKWKQHTERLQQYLKSLSEITQDEYEKLSRDEKKALWINAYNAFTVKVVLDHYPINGTEPYYPKNSFRQIPDAWDEFYFVVAGRRVNLNEIEHNISRRLNDPRIHFAVVCAAKGCAKINKEAYVATNLDAVLDAQTQKFILDQQNVNFDHKEKVVHVSKLFSWFPLDFLNAVGFKTVPFPPPKDDEVVLRYIVSRSPKEVQERFKTDEDYRAYKVLYKDYDWSLNDAD